MRFQVLRLSVFATLLLMLSGTGAAAGDFDWTRDFNIRAEADPSGFRAELATRFKIGDAEINAVIGNVERPADAYMIFRLGEMSSRPPRYVMERYRAERGKGWGVLARSLGIKPGSSEFHALKRGDDLYGGKMKNKTRKDRKPKDKGKDKGDTGKGKGKG